MSLPDVAQAQALAGELAALLDANHPASLAILGCAGGNGLERVDATETRRVVALDINPAYVEAATRRFAAKFESFEPVVCDVGAVPAAPFAPVDLVFAGLLLEYVPLDRALGFVRSAFERGGAFGCVLQEESASLASVSPSPYASLSILGEHMALRTSGEIVAAAASCGFRLVSSRSLTMPNGKILVSQSFVAL